MFVFLKSYKYYARFVSVISALVIIVASLDASQVINLFPEYANQINTILMIAGLLAPVIAQEKRVVRAEDLILEDINNVESEDDIRQDDLININEDDNDNDDGGC